MEYKLVFLCCALNEHAGTIDCLSRDLDSPKAASDFEDEFDRQAELVRENPELHAPSRVPEAAAKGYRAFFVKRYLVLYKIDGNRVVIAHLFHQTQNYAKFF